MIIPKEEVWIFTLLMAVVVLSDYETRIWDLVLTQEASRAP